MSTSTNLHINAKYGERDVRDILKSHLGIKDIAVRVNESTPQMLVMDFEYNNRHRSMFYHMNSGTPLGPAILLSLGADEDGHKIMKTIAHAIGGYFVSEDYDDAGEMITGMVWEEDGIPYFIKSAIVNNALEDNDDIAGLKRHIDEWTAKHRK